MTGGPVESTWTFESADGGTDVTIEPKFETRIPVLNQIARRVLLFTWKRQLDRFAAVVEERAKSSKKPSRRKAA